MMTQAKSTGSLNRRTFMKRMAGLGGALVAAGSVPVTRGAGVGRTPSGIRAERIGVQLYTVRDQLQQDFEGTIEKVAQIGYKEVEFAGYYGHTPEQVRQLLDRLGLTSPSTHIGLDALREDLDGQLQSAQTIGHQYITVPAIMEAFAGKMTPDAWPRYAEEFNQIGAACKAQGLGFAYHNHHFEFVPAGEEKTGYDVLLTETDPDLVSFELDLMWATLAGRDPVALFEQYPGRFVMWHVKDLKGIEAAREAASQGMQGFRAIMDRIAAVGEGDIDFTRIFAQAQQAGLQHFFVENDAPKDSLANIRTSYDHLVQMLSK